MKALVGSAILCAIVIPVAWRADHRRGEREKRELIDAKHQARLSELQREIATQQAKEQWVGKVQSDVLKAFRKEHNLR